MKREEIRKRIWEKEEKTRKITIKDLGVDIYYRPLTIEDEQRLKLDSDLMDIYSKSIEMIFQKALDEDGERIFTTPEDKEFIRTRMPSAILARIANAMTGMSFEEAKKN